MLAGAFISVAYAFLGWLVTFTARASLRPSVDGYRSPRGAHRRDHEIARALVRGTPPVIAWVLVLVVPYLLYLGYVGDRAALAVDDGP